MTPKIAQNCPKYQPKIHQKSVIKTTLKIALNMTFPDKYRKVASTNASRFVTRLVYMHTQNYNFLIRSPSWIQATLFIVRKYV